MTSQISEEKKKLIDQAFADGLYEGLEDIEFHLLLALAECKSEVNAAKTVGLSLDKAEDIFRELSDCNLICFCEESRQVATVSKHMDTLLLYSGRFSTKSIFSTPMARKVYRILKQSYLFVFVEVPSTVVISEKKISSLSSDSVLVGYYKNCRFDFVITDRAGRPMCVVEFQGSYHEDKSTKEKDRWKSEMLQSVNLPLAVIDSKNLDRVEDIIDSVMPETLDLKDLKFSRSSEKQSLNTGSSKNDNNSMFSESLHDRQIEQFVLGVMLADATTIPLITMVLGGNPDDFFTTDHQLIYSAILVSYERNSHADPGSVAHELERRQQISRAGGNIYLYDLQARIVETESAESKAQIVKDLSVRRQLIEASKEIERLVLNQDGDIQSIQHQIQQTFSKVSYNSDFGMKMGFDP